jgi:hypothetical protein
MEDGETVARAHVNVKKHRRDSIMNVGERLLHIFEGTRISPEHFFRDAYKIVHPHGHKDVTMDILQFQVCGIIPDYVAQVVKDMQTY